MVVARAQQHAFICCVLINNYLAAIFVGHAYAGGAFLATAQDYIIMRTERGWFCFPEVKIPLRFHKQLYTFIRLATGIKI